MCMNKFTDPSRYLLSGWYEFLSYFINAYKLLQTQFWMNESTDSQQLGPPSMCSITCCTDCLCIFSKDINSGNPKTALLSSKKKSDVHSEQAIAEQMEATTWGMPNVLTGTAGRYSLNLPWSRSCYLRTLSGFLVQLQPPLLQQHLMQKQLPQLLLQNSLVTLQLSALSQASLLLLAPILPVSNPPSLSTVSHKVADYLLIHCQQESLCQFFSKSSLMGWLLELSVISTWFDSYWNFFAQAIQEPISCGRPLVSCCSHIKPHNRSRSHVKGHHHTSTIMVLDPCKASKSPGMWILDPTWLLGTHSCGDGSKERI